MRNQPSFFDDMRLTLKDAIDLSVASLTEYGQRYRHWCIAYSGGDGLPVLKAYQNQRGETCYVLR